MKIENSNGVNINQYLKEEYAKEYVKLYTSLQQLIDNKHVLEDVMQDMLGLFYDAQKENRSPERIYGDTRDDFCNQVLQALQLKGEENKKQKVVNHKTIICYRVFIGLLCCGFACFIFLHKLWENGTIGTYKDGFQYFMDNRNYLMKYKSTPVYPEVEVDLYNLDSNIGKLIYDDGQVTIRIENMEYDTSGMYYVTFRSRGNYSKNGGTLVTPIFIKSLETGLQSFTLYEYNNEQVIAQRIYETSEANEFDEIMIGKLQIIIDGSAYACQNRQMDAFKYKDGDVFKFQLFTDEYYKENGFLIQDKLNQRNGKVNLRLYNLVQATWERVDSNRLNSN